MSLVAYDPFYGMRNLRQEIDRLFDAGRGENDGLSTEWSPRVDVREDDQHVVILADIPGMTLEDIHVNVEAGRLTIQGERSLEKEYNRKEFHRVERVYGRFSRVFQLANTTDVDNIKANYKHGVLEVVLPKKEAAKARPIQITQQ